MRITKRQYQILQYIISEYVRSALPVSSECLKQNYSLEVSSATIRNEMKALTEKGFLTQSHVSAGRIPSDQGYRLFVNRFLQGHDEKWQGHSSSLTFSRLTAKHSDAVERIQLAVRVLSEHASNLAVGYVSSTHMLWKEGWESVLRAPEFHSSGFASRLASFLGDFEGHIDQFEIQASVHVFIGKEVSFSRVNDFSVILAGYDLGAREKGTIALIGPKRMAYDSNIMLIRDLQKALKHDRA